MKALLCSEYGPPDKLAVHDIPSPQAGPGQVVVDLGDAFARPGALQAISRLLLSPDGQLTAMRVRLDPAERKDQQRAASLQVT